MPQISPKPIVLKDATLLVGADSYEKQISAATFSPASSVQQWSGMSPSAVYADVTTATWTLELSLAQDWETVGSLSRFLLANEGNTISGIFKPRNGGGSSFAATFIITPGAIGGAVGAFAESSVSLPLVGRPVEILAGGGIPTLAAATPASGAAAGGTLVQIAGSGFTGATAVRFGAVAATNYTIISDTLLVATTPAQPVGSKPVTVTNAVGTSATAPFSYV